MSGRCLLLAKAPVHDAIGDLVDGLEARGWAVDRLTWRPPVWPETRAWQRGEAALAHPNRFIRSAARALRRSYRELAGARAASDWCHDVERVLRVNGHDAVLAFVDGLPVGVAQLVARVARGAVLVSLLALAQECRHRRSLTAMRLIAHLSAPFRLHRDLLRPIDPRDVPLAVFPSANWRAEAEAAGVPGQASRVIPLGVPVAEPMPVRAPALPSTVRLLWVGRLSPEKGLHLFLDALPVVAARHPVRLTVVAARGPEGYARRVADMLKARGLHGLVDLRAAVPRSELEELFGQHDLLLFHSIFAEPVAQVLLRAAAVGLPVVGPASGSGRSLLREGCTAWCYAEASPDAIASAISRAIEGNGERQTRAQVLYGEVRDGHALRRTIEEFEAVLRARWV